jgi:2'-hydroxyisoflavone reductase
VVDRDNDLSALATGEWDAVMDTCGYLPGHVRPLAELLRERVGHYTFVSSVSVYADVSTPGMNEDAALIELEDPAVTDVHLYYGGLKVLCEEVVRDVYGSRCSIVRPGLIVGPWDPSDRFTYWPRRFDMGGEAIVPGCPDAPVQLANARDLAEWMVRAAAARVSGTFNGCGPQTPWTWRELVDACVHVAGPTAAKPVWVDEKFLLQHDVSPWAELPVWLPSRGTHASMLSVDVSRAVNEGLTFRSIDEVVADTLEWDRTRRDTPLVGPLSSDKEASVLAEWKARPA